MAGLLWELIRKFSSAAGIYSQIASTSENESTIEKNIFFFKKTLKEFWEKIEIKDPTEEEIDRTTFWNKLERLDSLLSLFCKY